MLPSTQLSMENTTNMLDIVSALARTELLQVLLMQAQNQKPMMLVHAFKVLLPTQNQLLHKGRLLQNSLRRTAEE